MRAESFSCLTMSLELPCEAVVALALEDASCTIWSGRDIAEEQRTDVWRSRRME